MKGGKLKQFLSQGLAKQGNWSCESDGRRLGLAGLRNCVRDHRRGRVSSLGMSGCVVHVHHRSWEGFGVMVTWAQALQSCFMADLPSSTIHLGSSTIPPQYFLFSSSSPHLIHWTEWMLFICFILIIHCNGPTPYLLLTIQTLFQR